MAVAGVGDAGGPRPGALVRGVRVSGHVRSSSITRALGFRRAVRLSLIGGFCGSARPSCGKWRVILQQRDWTAGFKHVRDVLYVNVNLTESDENSLSILDPSRDDDVLPPTLD